ncbi:hypothetical protein Droror1_Dr00016849 [Drosera rotundifolia]
MISPERLLCSCSKRRHALREQRHRVLVKCTIADVPRVRSFTPVYLSIHHSHRLLFTDHALSNSSVATRGWGTHSGREQHELESVGERDDGDDRLRLASTLS